MSSLLRYVKAGNLWKFYTDISVSGYNEKRAECNLCSKTLKFTSTTHNLKSHLSKVHNLQFETERVRNQPISRSKSRLIWSAFTDIDRENKTAVCRFCGDTLSFRSTSANLSSHLKRKHPDHISKLEGEDNLCDSEKETAEEEITELEYLEEFEDNDSEDETVNTLWSYFEKKKNDRARCVVCRTLVHTSSADLREHLRRNHPKLIIEPDESQDDQEEKEEEVYTEVLYIDEPSTTAEPRRSVAKEYKKDPQSTLKIKSEESLRSRRRSSSDYEDHRRKKLARAEKNTKNNSDDEEIDSFGTYIVCLLKKMPRNVSMKVQRDIINLIMNANLNEEQRERESLPKIIFDGNNIRACDENSFFVVTNNESEVTGNEAFRNEAAFENPTSSFSSIPQENQNQSS